MEQVLEQGGDFLHLLCQEWRGMAIMRGNSDGGLELLASLQGCREPAGAEETDNRASECDSRYRKLNSLLELFRREPDRNLAAELDRLLHVMSDNFGKEDDSMTMVGFPQAMAHSLHHQAICLGVANLRYRFCKEQKVNPDELGAICLQWLEHIEVDDAAFERFLVL